MFWWPFPPYWTCIWRSRARHHPVQDPKYKIRMNDWQIPHMNDILDSEKRFVSFQILYAEYEFQLFRFFRIDLDCLNRLLAGVRKRMELNKQFSRYLCGYCDILYFCIFGIFWAGEEVEIGIRRDLGVRRKHAFVLLQLCRSGPCSDIKVFDHDIGGGVQTSKSSICRSSVLHNYNFLIINHC